MILPKEVPYKHKLHSYYLKFENFVVAMQEEIGSGCIYCRSTRQEHAIYFKADALIRCIVENPGKPPQIYHQLGDVIQAFKIRPFIVSVHFLDDRAVRYWGQMPADYKTNDPVANTSSISLEIMVEHYKADRFSGFFDIASSGGDGGLLFFKDGKIAGGSYTWGQGGLSLRAEDYRRLVALFESESCTIEIGAFIPQR